MTISRRRFLQAGSIAGVATLIPMKSVFGQQQGSALGSGIGYTVPKEALRDPLSGMTRMMFTDNLFSKFSFKLKGVKLADMTLIEVQNLNPPFVGSKGTSTRECFGLVFQGPAGLALRQNTYDIEHQKLGKFQLFIVPGDKATNSRLNYVAIINRVFP